MRRIRYLTLTIGCCLLLLMAEGQKHDYVWLMGYNSHLGDTLGFHFGNTIFDFNSSTMEMRRDSLRMNFDFTNTSYCDSSGNLLFYTNGIYVANSLDETIENGDSLNAGWLQYKWDTTIRKYGYRDAQGVLAFQDGRNNSYFLLHSFVDSNVNKAPFGARLLLTYLDMDENVGHGKVINKNQTILKDSIGTALSATKHGNGRDWWILVQKQLSNCYYRILIDSSGPHVLPDLTCGAATVPLFDAAAACFSPDGSKYVYLNVKGGISLFDFDRCSGTLSNAKYMPLRVLVDSGWYGVGVAFSPNNRFLYASVSVHLYQFDLSAPNVFASIDTVGVWDGYAAPFGSIFKQPQIAPDGKIYINCGNTETVYHVINNPDAKGDSCNFAQHSIALPTFAGNSIPNFPNYRLGRKVGSECDTLWNDLTPDPSPKERVIKVFPSPATDVVTIDYGFTDWSKQGDVAMEIINELGQSVLQQQLPKYSGFQRLNVTSYPSGIYITYIKRNNQIIATSKFAKQ
ncbi:MAG: T9SS type A sorting domain-containing protein [Bacteroidetes bacterium]|nr:T9SS type A sorting domain-containing protein [Bacteroidota bacterium]